VKRYPVLVPTSAGVLTGVVHEPEGEPLACLVALHGGTGRSGPNRVWVRLAGALAADGFVVLRLDDHEIGSPLVREEYWSDSMLATGEGIAWFRERTRGLDMLLCGRCIGAAQTLSYAARHDDVAGIGLVVPTLQRGQVRGSRPLGREGFVMRMKRRAHRVGRAVAPSLTTRVASGIPAFDHPWVDPEVSGWFAAIDASVPMWVLLGERDHQWRRLWAVDPRPPELGAAEIEVVPDIRLNSTEYLREQQIVIERVTAWALRSSRTGASS
jgi:pimeloyl-ACP methyl ester carboxylesterase